ncbi:MAG: zinc ribbon domain-containing protein [Verrucomicrobia bacterium]|nr:zinc ribbon domain-containing protein [Verrucomicrobiota bacterium]
MPIYEYETIPQNKGQKAKRYELRQGMNEPELKVHPETGEPIKKVFSAFSVSAGERSSDTGGESSCCCGPQCSLG